MNTDQNFENKNFSSLDQQKEYHNWLSKMNEPAASLFPEQVQSNDEDSNSKEDNFIEALGDKSTLNSKKKTDRKYTCNQCQKSFGRLNRYRAHMHMHFGTQPFQCPVPDCNKAFSEKQNLKTHMLIHFDSRPFACPKKCGLSFRTKGNMMDHLRRHYNVRPFVCEDCGVGYYRKNILKRHKAECKGKLATNSQHEDSDKQKEPVLNVDSEALASPWLQDPAIDSTELAQLGKTVVMQGKTADTIQSLNSQPIQSLDNSHEQIKQDSAFSSAIQVKPTVNLATKTTSSALEQTVRTLLELQAKQKQSDLAKKQIFFTGTPSMINANTESKFRTFVQHQQQPTITTMPKPQISQQVLLENQIRVMQQQSLASMIQKRPYLAGVPQPMMQQQSASLINSQDKQILLQMLAQASRTKTNTMSTQGNQVPFNARVLPTPNQFMPQGMRMNNPFWAI